MKIIPTLIAFTLMSISAFGQTETEAKINVKVENSEGEAMSGEEITFKNLNTGKKYTDITDDQGKFNILVPKGSKYSVSYRTFTDAKEYSQIDIPKVEGFINFDFKLIYELPKVITLKNVFFDTGKSTLKSSSNEALNNLYSFLDRKKDIRIEIGGHTDNVGDDESNMKLSQTRANAVRDYLINKGISADRLIAKGYGETDPVASNDTPEGRQKNRRTQIRILE